MFYYGGKGWYCRKCVRFLKSEPIDDEIKIVDSDYQLSFSLTRAQQEISKQLNSLTLQGKSILLEAVCGAGKTELVFETISQQLSLGHKVGFAIARRQVVLEITERLGNAFNKAKVIAVCQGYTDDVIGDIIVLTCHQLYRYQRYFDLLIIDEPDAFPFKGNDVLHAFALTACKGSTIYLTATPDEQLIKMVQQKKIEYLYLPKRPSNKPLIVPKAKYGFIYIRLFYYLFSLKERPIIVFIPTLKLENLIYHMAKFFLRVCCINSISQEKDKTINDFKQGMYDVCLATTVLERGITIPHVNVIIVCADHQVYDEASLVQCAGRVGRSYDDPYGQAIFLARKRTINIDRCIERIKRANG